MDKFCWKKGVCLVLAATLTVFFCACLQQNQTGEEQTEKPSQTAQAEVTEIKRPSQPIPSTSEITDTYAEPTEDPMKQSYREDPAAFVVFSQSVEPRETYVPLEEVLAYESQYPDCNGTWYRDQLTGEDLSIYNSYIYAMEHCFTGFELYVEDKDKDFTPIRQALSLDSPFLAQNTSRYEHIYDTVNYIGERIYIGIDHFAPKRWGMKMEALKECRRIVEGIPVECTTQPEKMEYLYRYVCDHVKYVEYERMVDEDYLYDAVIQGETVCDGYSNMLLLLFRLIGVECCEVMGQEVEDFEQLSPEEQEETVGHTWVVARFEEEFYHFDPTFEDTKDSTWGKDTVFFAFSDQLLKFQYIDLDDFRPVCPDTALDFDYADLEVASFTKKDDIRKIAALTEEKSKEGEYTTLIAIREPMSTKKFGQLVQNYGLYAEGVQYAGASYVELGSCTLVWLTVEKPEAS